MTAQQSLAKDLSNLKLEDDKDLPVNTLLRSPFVILTKFDHQLIQETLAFEEDVRKAMEMIKTGEDALVNQNSRAMGYFEEALRLPVVTGDTEVGEMLWAMARNGLSLALEANYRLEEALQIRRELEGYNQSEVHLVLVYRIMMKMSWYEEALKVIRPLSSELVKRIEELLSTKHRHSLADLGANALALIVGHGDPDTRRVMYRACRSIALFAKYYHLPTLTTEIPVTGVLETLVMEACSRFILPFHL